MPIDFPNTPSNDDKFLNSNGALYTYDTPDDSWTAYAAPGTISTNPAPSQISAVPAFDSGTGTEGDPFVITPATVADAGGKASSAQIITLTGADPADTVKFLPMTSITGVTPKFTQPVWLVDAAGQWTGQLLYDDALGQDVAAGTYTATIRLGNNVWFQWAVTQQA